MPPLLLKGLLIRDRCPKMHFSPPFPPYPALPGEGCRKKLEAYIEGLPRPAWRGEGQGCRSRLAA